MYILFKSLESVRFFMFFKPMLTKAAFIWSKYSYIVIYYYNLKITILYFIIFFMYFIPVMAKLNFQHHYSSLQCHMILQKSF